MSELQLKYNTLDNMFQQQVMVFIDYLLNVQKNSKTENLSTYKQKLLKVGTWSDEDLKIFDDNRKWLNQWTITEF